MLPIELIAKNLADEVVSYIRSQMEDSMARETEFHEFRMNFLYRFSDNPTTTEKLYSVADSIKSPHRFDLVEITSDKNMGESLSRFIFSKVILRMNEEWKKILEYELDRVNAETNTLLAKHSVFRDKIGQH